MTGFCDRLAQRCATYRRGSLAWIHRGFGLVGVGASTKKAS